MFSLERDLKRELNLTKQEKMTVVVCIDGDEMLQLGKTGWHYLNISDIFN